MASSDEAIPDTPPKTKSRLIGGLSGRGSLPISKKNLKRTSPFESTSEDICIDTISVEEKCRHWLGETPCLNKDFPSRSSSASPSPLRPLYTGSDIDSDTQDPFACNSCLSSTSSISSLPSNISVCQLSPLSTPDIESNPISTPNTYTSNIGAVNTDSPPKKVPKLSEKSPSSPDNSHRNQSESQSPLKPLYTGSQDYYYPDAQDPYGPYAFYSCLSSSSSDSSLHTQASVCLLSPLGSPSASEKDTF